MRILILGICGTFMGGVARLARQLGHEVCGLDAQVYPPMSEHLAAQGIHCEMGYKPESVQALKPDWVIVGNAISRGNPALEAVINARVPYSSGPEWLFEAVLKYRRVLAVSGTHGKTTTTSLLTWIMTQVGLNPGYLIGGVDENLGQSADLGQTPFFIIEADEYDTAFFDKRAKFMHYRPEVLIINNLEYDHADIYPNLSAIQLQFQYLLRTVLGTGKVLYPENTESINAVLEKGCFTPCETVQSLESVGKEGGSTADWKIRHYEQEGSDCEIYHQGISYPLHWRLYGKHNAVNALAAIAAAHTVGVPIDKACAALSSFQSPKRRLEIRGVVGGITVIDDFAHHPTAIAVTLEALRSRVKDQRIIAILEFASNTMRSGYYERSVVLDSLKTADEVLLLQPLDQDWSQTSGTHQVFPSIEAILKGLSHRLKSGDQVIIMSNKSFGGLHDKLLLQLKQELGEV